MEDVNTVFIDNHIKNVKAVFIDCDGVLYPPEACTDEEIAVKGLNAALAEYKIPRDELDQARADLKKKKIRGMFNAVRVLCERRGIPFNEFAKLMASKIDYSHIPEDAELLDLLRNVGKVMPVYIVTNNTRPHLEKVFSCLRGGRVCQDTQNDLNIKFISIEETSENGIFHSKKMEGQWTALCRRVSKEIRRPLKPENFLVLDDSQSILDEAVDQNLSIYAIQHPRDTKEMLRRLLEKSKNERCLSLRKTCDRTGD